MKHILPCVKVILHKKYIVVTYQKKKKYIVVSQLVSEMVDVVTCICSLVFEKFFVCADSQQSLLSNQMPNTGFFWQKETESLKMDDIFEFKT